MSNCNTKSGRKMYISKCYNGNLTKTRMSFNLKSKYKSWKLMFEPTILVLQYRIFKFKLRAISLITEWKIWKMLMFRNFYFISWEKLF